MCICIYSYMFVNICLHICIYTLALCLFHSLITRLAVCCSVLPGVAVCCRVLQCVAVCCSVLQCVQCRTVRCSALQCVAVRCSALQCVAVCCSRFHFLTLSLYAFLSLLLCRSPSPFLSVSLSVSFSVFVPLFPLLFFACTLAERWGAGVETQKILREEIGEWGRVPFNEPYAPLLSTIYDGA